MSKDERKLQTIMESEPAINKALVYTDKEQFGVLDSKFLCQSISILDPAEPITVPGSSSIEAVAQHLRDNRVGCVLVVDEAGKLEGIFSERDYILKVQGVPGAKKEPVSNFMTRNPVAEAPDIAIAYALNLMSQGGFRHLPLVDSDNMPVAVISVKDVIDYIVSSFIDDLMNFEVELPEDL